MGTMIEQRDPLEISREQAERIVGYIKDNCVSMTPVTKTLKNGTRVTHPFPKAELDVEFVSYDADHAAIRFKNKPGKPPAVMERTIGGDTSSQSASVYQRTPVVRVVRLDEMVQKALEHAGFSQTADQGIRTGSTTLEDGGHYVHLSYQQRSR